MRCVDYSVVSENVDDRGLNVQPCAHINEFSRDVAVSAFKQDVLDRLRHMAVAAESICMTS